MRTPDVKGRPRTALLADDDPAVRQLAALLLQRCGLVVLEAADGGEAVRLGLAYPGPIDLLVADLTMPGLCGPRVAEALAAGRPGMRVLFFSGYSHGQGEGHCRLPEEAAFLEKPFRTGDFVQAVQDLLGG